MKWFGLNQFRQNVLGLFYLWIEKRVSNSIIPIHFVKKKFCFFFDFVMRTLTESKSIQREAAFCPRSIPFHKDRRASHTCSTRCSVQQLLAEGFCFGSRAPQLLPVDVRMWKVIPFGSRLLWQDLWQLFGSSETLTEDINHQRSLSAGGASELRLTHLQKRFVSVHRIRPARFRLEQRRWLSLRCLRARPLFCEFEERHVFKKLKPQ